MCSSLCDSPKLIVRRLLLPRRFGKGRPGYQLVYERCEDRPDDWTDDKSRRCHRRADHPAAPGRARKRKHRPRWPRRRTTPRVRSPRSRAVQCGRRTRPRVPRRTASIGRTRPLLRRAFAPALCPQSASPSDDRIDNVRDGHPATPAAECLIKTQAIPGGRYLHRFHSKRS